MTCRVIDNLKYTFNWRTLVIISGLLTCTHSILIKEDISCYGGFAQLSCLGQGQIGILSATYIYDRDECTNALSSNLQPPYYVDNVYQGVPNYQLQKIIDICSGQETCINRYHTTWAPLNGYPGAFTNKMRICYSCSSGDGTHSISCVQPGLLSTERPHSTDASKDNLVTTPRADTSTEGYIWSQAQSTTPRTSTPTTSPLLPDAPTLGKDSTGTPTKTTRQSLTDPAHTDTTVTTPVQSTSTNQVLVEPTEQSEVAVIAGSVAGGVCVLIAVVVLAAYCVLRRRRELHRSKAPGDAVGKANLAFDNTGSPVYSDGKPDFTTKNQSVYQSTNSNEYAQLDKPNGNGEYAGNNSNGDMQLQNPDQENFYESVNVQNETYASLTDGAGGQECRDSIYTPLKTETFDLDANMTSSSNVGDGSENTYYAIETEVHQNDRDDKEVENGKHSELGAENVYFELEAKEQQSSLENINVGDRQNDGAEYEDTYFESNAQTQTNDSPEYFELESRSGRADIGDQQPGRPPTYLEFDQDSHA